MEADQYVFAVRGASPQLQERLNELVEQGEARPNGVWRFVSRTPHLGAVLELLRDSVYLMARGAPPEGELADPRAQALVDYWSEMRHPAFHRNERWFQAHEHEFLAGEFIVVCDEQLVARLRDRNALAEFLRASPVSQASERLFHEMVGDGQEAEFRV